MPKKGYKQSKEHIASRGTRIGPLNPNWKGGIKSKNPQAYRNKKTQEWRRKNPEKARRSMAIRKARYRARQRMADGSFTNGEWELLKIRYNFTCVDCKKREPEIKLSVDHVIPLSRGGSNWIENIEPRCMPCNRKKGAKMMGYEL